MVVSAAGNGLCRKNACLSARHVARTHRRLEGRLGGHVRGRRPARAAGRCRRCRHITTPPETLSGDVRAVAAHGAQRATPWALMAHTYRSVSRHARRCSSNPPQGAGWDHSAEEAFMARGVWGRPGVVGSRTNSPGHHHLGACGRVAVLNGRVPVGRHGGWLPVAAVWSAGTPDIETGEPWSIIYRY